MLSANGSPLANPYQLDLKNWFNLAVTDGDGPDTEIDSPQGDVDGPRGLSKLGSKLKKQRSIVRRLELLTAPFRERAVCIGPVVGADEGHVLEFNPLQTTPEERDALEGITDSAKKQAKEDMARLIQITMQR
ncbi:hypothetical protein TRAPUB_7454 [Trametes pubescens]|uniref:Uncharacterized protein n=1 Tax=Trametes pubescens TaxID=154538 RepID=A0A1M2V381_TRAPU|nr:hypothetical protein TRAPUB_7454 [Trametes pubescens]